MGKVILCEGRLAKKPYVVPETGRRLYSIEEVCHYATANIYSMDMGFFTDEFINFVRNELELADRADLLAKLLADGHGFKDVLTALLCSSNLYDKDEVLRTVALSDRLATLANWQRRAHLGYTLLAEGKYLQALRHFRGILKEERLSEQDYGEVLRAMGLANMRISAFSDAADLFYRSYLHGRNIDSLVRAILALELGEVEGELPKKILAEKESTEATRLAKELWKKTLAECEKEEPYLEAEKVVSEFGRGFAEAEKKTAELVAGFKAEYRKGLVS